MSEPWTVRIFENHQQVYAAEVSGPVELGRQADYTERTYSHRLLEDGRWRVVLARPEDQKISRKHALVVPLGENRVRVQNLSARQVLHLPDHGDLPPEAAREVTLPLVLGVGTKTIRIQGPEPEAAILQSLTGVTMPPGRVAAPAVSLAALAPPGSPVALESVLRWMQSALDVFHSAAGGSDFFDRAARAAVDLVGLDSARVLLWQEDGRFTTAAVQARGTARVEADWRPSRRVLQHVRQERRTFWQGPEPSPMGSLVDIRAVVAAPILGRQGEAIGALYGERRAAGAGAGGPIGRLEATLVELLAGGIAAGLARVEQEQAALRARVQFEQFFSKELAEQLAANPDLLRSRDAEVTVLFADVRGFSRISERLGPARTIPWISDLLGVLSDCVLAEGGVLVDYIGDELMAMWGAPVDQPDHAARAARAALAMLGHLGPLNERWESVLNEPVRLSIGLNTGAAQVGNIGSHRKLKYGPLGNTVNLASRVRGASKYLKAPLLATQATREKLDPSFAARRLCRVRVVNIAEPVALYELAVPGQPGGDDLRHDYEAALAAFEGRHFRTAVRILGNVLNEHADDGPALVLLERVVQFLVGEGGTFDPVWELPGK